MRATLTALIGAASLIGVAPAQSQPVNGDYPSPSGYDSADGYQPGYGASQPGAYQPGDSSYRAGDSTYQERLREYQRQRSEYERQRREYDEQFTTRVYEESPPPVSYEPSPPSVTYEVERTREPSRDYYRYDQTAMFRDDGSVELNHAERWYRDRGCRLASPGGDPDRVVPVCPDSMGRYRETD